ncbi:MAG: 3-oxoacyl-ACP reductase FabG [Clostridia bacterium]|nr:3-oxoacyl-ACP reductase FabG [Clostridia bacterium]
MRVLVTGGSRGIGAACVREFAKNGDTVAFIYHSDVNAALDLADRTGAYAVRADLGNAIDATRGVEEAIALLGGIDVLVNNAGISQIKLFTDLTDADWNTMIDTNLGGAFFAARVAVKAMIAQQSGRIVNVGSMWGKTGASCEVHYSAAKAGLRGFTMALAKELGPSHITVNCVEPGVIDTDMNAALDEQTRAELCDATPLCRIGTPEEVAAAVCFLASDKASFITGQILGVDGGYAI